MTLFPRENDKIDPTSPNGSIPPAQPPAAQPTPHQPSPQTLQPEPGIAWLSEAQP